MGWGSACSVRSEGAGPGERFGPRTAAGDGDDRCDVGARWNGGEAYCNLTVDSHGRVAAFTYLGPEPVEAKNLSCIVGMHEAYLNSAVLFFNKGEVHNWIAYFRQGWADALYHDRFHHFCLSLRMGMSDDDGVNTVLVKVREALEGGAADQEISQVRRDAVGVGGSSLPRSTKKMMDMHLMEFLKNNRNLLQRYWPGV